MNKLFLASTIAIASVAAVPGFTQAAEQTSFVDVPENHIFYKEITSLAGQGILSGYNDGTFLPSKNVSRAEAAKIIAVALNLDTTSVNNPNFKDVSTAAWYYPYVAVLAEKGIIQGYNNNYSPDAPLTRGDMAIILTKAYELQLATTLTHPFTDVKADSYYSYHVQTLLNNDITKGESATTYSPSTYVKRGQLAAFVTRAQALKVPTVPEEQPQPNETEEPNEGGTIEPTNPGDENSEQPVTPAPPSENETVSVTSILQKHQGTYSSLEANAYSQANTIISAAKAELDSLLAAGDPNAISTVVDKYAGQAFALEASIDASFNAFYNTVVADLTANGYDASHADSFKSSYAAAKESLKNSILSQL